MTNDVITILFPFDRSKVWLSCDWQCHMRRPNYSRNYAGVDYAGNRQPLWVGQHYGKVLQAMWSTQGYGWTVFTEFYDIDGNAVLRIRDAHMDAKPLVSVGEIVQPKQQIGWMGTTGNSTGIHDHCETWLKINGVWQNVDPYDTKYNVKLVNNVNELIPIGGTPVPPPPPQGWYIPEMAFPLVKNIQTFNINLRTLPTDKGNATQVIKWGAIKPNSIWEFCGSHVDVVGNVWFAVRKGQEVGWAASLYNSEPWIVPVEEQPE